MPENLWSLIPADWQVGLSACRPKIDAIDQMLSDSERSGAVNVPSREMIFTSLSVAPKDVTVVLLGQDPYPKVEHANGLAFAVPKNSLPLPGSLRNIFKEVSSDIGVDPNTDCTLSSWVKQGVLLLNTSLTTQEGVRAGHSTWPWQPVISSILSHVVDINPDVVAVLWGNNAKQFAGLFDPQSIVESAHPSPLSASRGFLGSKPFSRVNGILSANGRTVITW